MSTIKIVVVVCALIVEFIYLVACLAYLAWQWMKEQGISCMALSVKFIQLFRERLSCKWGKAYATMSKVIMVKCSFYGCLSEPQGVSAWWKETAQTRVFVLPPSLLLNHFNRLLAHNTTRHCRVRFYASVGQPLSKQLYI